MIVYGLVDPITRQLRYVGQTVRSGKVRLAQHLRTANQKTTPPVNAWMRGLMARSASPELLEIESCASLADLHEAESFWICYSRAIGASILNVMEGGTSHAGHRHSAETRARWSKERRGDKAGNFGNRRTPEQKAMFAGLTRDWIAKNGHPMQGRKHSAETLAKLSKSRAGIALNIPKESQERKSAAIKRMWLEKPGYKERMCRPGLSNPGAKLVEVDGRHYAYAELARLVGLSAETTRRRILKYLAEHRPLTMGDFTWRRKVGTKPA